MRSTSRSEKLYEAAARVLVGGVNSPVRAFRAVGGVPIFLERAEGAFVFDADGHCYIDLVGSWGPVIVGHAHPAVVEAVCEAASRGLSFGACCEAEARLAGILCEAIPSVQMLRLVNSGTEAAMSAIRLARAVTGRTKVVKFAGCYHGHVDGLLVVAGSGAVTHGAPDSAGVPKDYAELTLPAPYNNLEVVEALMSRYGRDIAAVIVEPLAGNMGFVPPVDGFLPGLRRLCDEHKALLIFDEVMTGFRVAWGGYQNLCGVQPDLTCLGKVIGGGLPVAAYGGPRELMWRVSPMGPVYQAGTLSGNPPGMAAGIATLELCQREGFYESLAARTARLASGLASLAQQAGLPLWYGSEGGMFGFAFSERPVCNFEDAKACDHGRYARFFHAMLERGVWLPPSGYEAMFLSSAHTETEVEKVLAAASEALGSIVA